MMANFFDQFDAPAAPQNFFDQFDAEAAKASATQKLAEGLNSGKVDDGKIYDAVAWRGNAGRPKANATDAAVSGATLGWADEAVAAAMAPIDMATRGEGFTEAYRHNVAEQRGRLNDYRKENPVAASAAELVGGLASPVASLKIGGPIASAAATGALYGGGYGLGASEATKPEDLALDAAAGVGTGAALGAGIAGALTAGKAAAAPVARNVSAWVNPEGRAVDQVARDLARDRVTPAAARAELDAAAGKPMTIGDLGGRNMTGLGRAVATGKGEGAERMRQMYEARQLDAPARIADDLKTALSDPAAFYPTLENIITRRQAVAGPLYERAYAQPMPDTPIVKSILATPAGQKAVANAKALSANEGIEFKADVRGLDLIKRSLDDMIAAADRGGQGNEARVLREMKNRLVREVDRKVPEYRAAREAYSSEADLENALTRGRELLKAEPELAVKEITAMSTAERDVARLGMARELQGMFVDPSRTVSQVNRVLNSERIKPIVRQMFPDDASYNAFRGSLLREAQMVKRGQTVTGGSQTVDKAADRADVDVSGAMSEVLSGRPVAGALSVVRDMGGRIVRGVNEKTADKLADILTSTDPARQRAILDQIEAMLPKDQLRRLMGQLAAIEAPQGYMNGRTTMSANTRPNH
jgi:hypothetical protein